MKSYRPDLLETAPGYRERLEAPADPVLAALISPFRAEAAEALPWIASTAKGLLGEEDATFDLLYRRGHRLAGMAGLLGLPKLAHVLELLAFALDLGRELQTFERHSLGYLIALLTTGAGAILDDLAGPRGISERDVGDTVDECRTYLAGAFKQLGQAKPQAKREPGAVPAKAVPPALHVVPLEPEFPLDPGQDEPEELRIPGDKIGLTSDFCEESRDNLAVLGRLLIGLEEVAEPIPVVNEIFRSVHTVKGGARLLQVGKVERLAHAMEALLDEVRTGARPVGTALVDVLLDGRKLLAGMVDEIASRGPVRTRIAPALAAIAALRAGVSPSTPEAPAPPAASTSSAPPARSASSQPDTIRVTIDRLDDVLNTASEVFIGRIRLKSDVDALAAAVRQFGHALQGGSAFGIRPLLDRLAEGNRRLLAELPALLERRQGSSPTGELAALVDRLHRELSLEVAQHEAPSPEDLNLNLLSIENIRKRLDKNVEQLEQLSGRLQYGAMRFRMVPIAHLFDRFPVQMRELARQLGKKVRIEIGGTETELDKVMVNQLADPLLHILRNSLDHGIEDPATRSAAGKPDTGRIGLRAFYQGSNAVIEIRDDGRGIDAARVLAKAVDSGLVEADRAATLSRGEILQLIFAPGLSTAAALSTVSGRGVGMDVVMTAISQVQGSVAVDSTPGEGTIISIRLPLTLAVVGILLIREGAHLFALPIQHVEEVITVQPDDLRQVGGTTLYSHRGATLPVTTLSNVLHFPPSVFAERDPTMVILAEGERRVGLLLDAVLGRQDVLIKNLGRLIRKAPFVIGCTILSDSRLVLILNAWELINTQNRKLVTVGRPSDHHGERRKHTVLVVDDSSMQRNHLGALLTQAGYRVDTAENGFAALQKLRSLRFSAFCVDIVMPMMDGFEFTERLRRLPDQGNLPVLLITGLNADALASERQRASELGVAGVFGKPVIPTELLRVLDEVCLPAQAPAIAAGGLALLEA